MAHSRQFRWSVVVLAGASMIGVGSAADTPEDSSALESAIDWYKNVYAMDFVEDDPNFYDHYADHVYLGFGKTVGHLRNAGVQVEMGAYTQDWVDRGWANSELQSVEGIEIDARSALLTAYWRIEAADGATVTECDTPGWRYVVVKPEATWQVAAEFEAACLK